MVIGESRASIRQRARRLSPWGFPIIYLGWAFLFWSPIVTSDSSVWVGSNLVLFLVGGTSPLLAALSMAWLSGGIERVYDLLYRFVDHRRITLRWWIIILVFWPLFDVLMAGAAVGLGISQRPIDVVWTVFSDLGSLGFLLALSFVFPAVEEVGLRGYYLDALQERFGPSVAGLINGGTWAIWHAPFVWFPDYYANTTFHPELWWWLPSIVLQTVIIVWVYNNTRRSILAVVIFHAMMNLTGEVFGLAPELFPFLLVGYTIIAGGLIIHWRRTGVDTATRRSINRPGR